MFKFRKQAVSPEIDVLSSPEPVEREKRCQGDSVAESRFTVLPQKDDDSHQQARRESGGSCGGLSDSGTSGKIVLDRKRKERHESTSQGLEKKVIRSVSDDESINDSNRNGDFRRTLSHDNFNETKQKQNKQVGMRKPIGQDLVEIAKTSGEGVTENGTSLIMNNAEPQFDVMRKITISENYEPELQRQLERSANWSTVPVPVKKTHKRRHRSSKRQSRVDTGKRRDEQLEVEIERVDCVDVELHSPSSSSSTGSIDDCPELVKEKEQVPSVEVDEVEDVSSQAERLMALGFLEHGQVTSIRAQLGGTSADDEVMLSPRNSVLGKEGIDIPPSPPLHQAPIDPPITRQGYLDGNPVQKMNELSRQITSLKRQLKNLEIEYEQVYGYRPSHSDKLNNKEIKKCVLQLTKAKKELKLIREDPSCLHNMSGASAGVSGNILCVNRTNSIPPTKGTAEYAKYLEATVREIERTLADKRRSVNRPDELERMNSLELQEEKYLMQRQLLVLEKKHGRPTSKQEKDIVRPLYDRYRAIKRFSVKVVCVRESSLDLPPIIEHETLELETPEQVLAPRSVVNEIWQSGDRRQLQVNEEEEDRDDQNDYNSMTLGELETKQRQAKDEKRKMRSAIRKFESDFQNVAGRPPQREEKYSSSEMELAYQKYKRVKATVRLLDVLISKRRVPALITDSNQN